MSGPADLDGAVLRNLLAHTTRAYEEQVAALAAEKELALVTLASIGDGVIRTDAAGGIEYLNPVGREAHRLEARRGRGAGRSARSSTSSTRRASGAATAGARRRVDRCLKEGARRRAGRQHPLVHRDGHRYAIESTGAPIRDARGAIDSAPSSSSRTSPTGGSWPSSSPTRPHHDELTGLLNRRSSRPAASSLSTAAEAGHEHGLCYVDLDQFKLVNDTAGHLAGDELLTQVTAVLTPCLRTGTRAARLGGDEFGVLLEDTGLEAGAAHRRRTDPRRPPGARFVWRERIFAVGATVGVVPIDPRFGDVARAALGRRRTPATWPRRAAATAPTSTARRRRRSPRGTTR